jgi:hypothetical protein
VNRWREHKIWGAPGEVQINDFHGDLQQSNHTKYTNEKTADHADSADKTASLFTILEKEIGG